MAFTYSSGTSTVTAAAALVTLQPGQWCVIQNTGATNAAFLGGPTVTTSGANVGYSLAPGASVTLPAIGGEAQTLWAVSTTTTLVWLKPAL